MGKRVPGGSAPVSSPGIRPKSHTARASACGVPAPSTSTKVAMFSATRA